MKLLLLLIVIAIFQRCLGQNDDEPESKNDSRAYQATLSRFNQLEPWEQDKLCNTIKPDEPIILPSKNHTANRYVGCFKDTGERMFKKAMLLGDGTSVKNCLSVCRKGGYVYAGAENGNECFCGNRYPDLEKFPELNAGTACNVNCRADPSVKCGGYWASSVYETGNSGNVCPSLLYCNLQTHSRF